MKLNNKVIVNYTFAKSVVRIKSNNKKNLQLFQPFPKHTHIGTYCTQTETHHCYRDVTTSIPNSDR